MYTLKRIVPDCTNSGNDSEYEKGDMQIQVFDKIPVVYLLLKRPNSFENFALHWQ